MPLALHHHDPATQARRRRLSYTWAGLVVGWSFIRTLIVWAAVGDYGLNPWIYLVIDLASACIDAITTPRMVLSFIDDHMRRAFEWALCSLVAFIVPDAYIFWGTRTLPTKLIVFILAIITVTLSIGVFGTVRKIRAGRAARAAAARAGVHDHASA